MILEVSNLQKTYKKNHKTIKVVDGVSFQMTEGACLGLVGESGCGKSTVANMVTGLVKPDEGTVLLDGVEMQDMKQRERQKIFQTIQMVFQMPQDSFDPRRSLEDSIMEGMRNAGMKKKKAYERLKELLFLVELDETIVKRYPHEVSGGQCQRAAIARALAVNPKLLICDEATSALDVTVQRQIIDLLKSLQKEMNLSILLICHDLALVQEMCDSLMVMKDGKILETGAVNEVMNHPEHEYTKQLIESAL